ncbi:hypothetical protein A3C87_01350 [Candidatus Kaiserbacteria bacterium RIFCSPHIGHO2_02_FULL_49_34]|uniref:Bacterial type II secretion system protein E domain-containing protein n=1 Tax=Candidatus Kaiserbacteria bacterium RIFCSPHIGHO2_02_FULL_49_34 TaxID=1798491 RepID=A0A1F6DNY3_9BACT|nr:MAG: hypothetical protein A3C87_01350 [Candidatus Kaiserbacteria bacterium RIFCSPHIGHO2_02_FULL_49_34]
MQYAPLLKEHGYITDEHIAYVQGRIQNEGLTEEAVFLEIGVPADAMRGLLAQYYDLPTRAIDAQVRIKNDVLQYIAEESAKHYRMVPLDFVNGTLTVGVADPDMPGIRDALNFIASNRGVTYVLEVLLEQDLEHALKSYENIKGDVGEALGEIDTDIASLDEEVAKVGDNEIDALSEDAPVTKIVSTVLRYAIDGRASDIHIEPYETLLVVRFRIDGNLVRSLELPKRIHPSVIARIKILSQLRLDEKRKPQDGRFSVKIHNRKVDFRVSILPTSHGEKVVMRILDTMQGARTFDDIGITPHVAAVIRKALKAPHGIVLLSGPTGSGKTTTLYAMLQELDRERKNIISLEDPVEYNIEGISQSQVRPEIGYTFASGLRSILRQDPDVIMVGEIRDRETAQLAVQAALTGHLVLSTIHTNSAIGVITRLIDMGVDPYLIAPTLRIAIAQRLVQRIVKEGAEPVPRTAALNLMLDKQFADLPPQYLSRIPSADHFLQARPSAVSATGKSGRIAMLEALEITDDIQKIILEGADEQRIYESARANGFTTLREDAIIHALNHDVSYDEVEVMTGEELAAAVEEPPAPETVVAPPSEEAPPVVAEQVAPPVAVAVVPQP